MTPTQSIIVYGILAGLCDAMGVGLLVWKEKWAKEHTHLLNAFAAGVIVAVVFMHLLPEALNVNRDRAILFMLGGFMLFYLLENVLIVRSETPGRTGQGNSDAKLYARARVAGLGLFLHSMIDGVIIGVGFEVSNELGLIATIAIIMHEFPQGIAIRSVLFEAGLTSRNGLIYSLAVAAATPVGAILSLAFLGRMSPGTVGLLLAMGSGTFLYVGGSDLIPAAHARGGRLSVVFFLLGVAFLWVTARLLTHGH